MNILLTIPDLTAASGGPAVLVTRLAGALRAEGHRVWLLFGERPELLRVPVPEGVDIRPVPVAANPWRRYRQHRLAVDSLIRAEQIEVVHDFGLWLPENAASAQAAQALGIPWITQPCSMLQDWAMLQRAPKKRLAWALYQRRLIRRASAMIAACTEEARESAARLPPAMPMHCIAHGVDMPPQGDAPRERQALYLGRLHYKKQVNLLLDAWAALRPQGWTLVIAGTGEQKYEAALKAQAESLGLADRVRFLGAVYGEDKHRLLARSQIFLQPSQQENFGLAVLEALAHAVPALTTEGMPWSALPAAGCGWSVGTDAASITDGLRTALQLPPETLAVMGAKARQFAAGFSWAETARRTQRVYAQAV